MIRKIFFWAHLVSGVLAGIVILTMSVTGVLLTYERQMLSWSAETHYIPVQEQSTRLPLKELIFLSQVEDPEFTPTTLVINKDPGAPVALRAGRRGGLSLNPYTGAEMEASSESMESFFTTVTRLHRWFNLTGESRDTARAITGASNLIFLFLVLSGIYLWLPRMWKWAFFKAHLFFNNKTNNSKARDYNWHHVFGIWSAIPLIIVVATACVFSYGWANSLLYQAFGEEAPVRGRGGPAPAQEASNLPQVNHQFMNLDQLLLAARAEVESEFGDWRQISINLPTPASPTVQFAVDLGNGGQPHLRHNLELNRENGSLDSWRLFSAQSAAQRARSIVRFLHTGEALGLLGQTIAGLVSLFSLLMVWTGLALSYRRLIRPLLSR